MHMVILCVGGGTDVPYICVFEGAFLIYCPLVFPFFPLFSFFSLQASVIKVLRSKGAAAA